MRSCLKTGYVIMKVKTGKHENNISAQFNSGIHSVTSRVIPQTAEICDSDYSTTGFTPLPFAAKEIQISSLLPLEIPSFMHNINN